MPKEKSKENEKAKKKYSLYLFASKEENVEEAMKYRFNRINKRYILVYTDELLGMLQQCHYHIIAEDEIGHLSDAEKMWLLEANIKIIAEESAKDQERLMLEFGKRIERLEKELESESHKVSNEKVNNPNGEQ